ncbi:hypothetical protein WG909_12280 [Peptostreptococcaceae bacterium AGR-M142]
MDKINLRNLYRYDSKTKTYYIDIQLEDYRDAYSDWDYSPFNNRDLDDDLTEYLLECSYELNGRKNIIIVFHILHQKKNLLRENKSREGMYNYFQYKIRKLNNQRVRLIKNTLNFFLIGIVLLLLRYITEINFQKSIITQLIEESFIIGGWVMIWEMFSTWFFNVKELSNNIKQYKKLKNIKIIFIYNEE